jgi:adenylate cyclase
MRKARFELIVPFIVAIIFVPLNFVPFFTTAEQRVYDLLLHVRPPIEERPEILLLDVDDTAIANVGLWPWSRDYAARGLLRLREFGAAYVTFDVEYVDTSPQAVDGQFLRNRLPEEFDASIEQSVAQVRQFVGALQEGQWPLQDADELVDGWAAQMEDMQSQLLRSVGSVVQDNDAFLGQAARFHGQTFFTVNILDYDEVARYDREEAARRLSLQQIAVGSDTPVRPGEDIRPAIPVVLDGARGAGFPNVVVDADGVRRRIDLVARVEDRYYAQLVLKPLLQWLGQPEVVVENDQVVLVGARHPDEDSPRDIRIPVTTDGRMLINWPKAEYLDSFRHLSFWNVVFDWLTEDDMIDLLRVLQPNLGRLYADSGNLLPAYDFALAVEQDVLDGGETGQLADWAAAREIFFETLADYVNSDVLDVFLEQLQVAIDSGEFSEEAIPQLRQIGTDVELSFTALRQLHEQFIANRETLWDALPGSFIIIGHVGTSTTDIGVTPFDEEYMNVGTHAAVTNTILQENFLDDLPWWTSVLVLLGFALITAAAIRKTGPQWSILIGLGIVLILSAAGVALFVFTGTYLNLITPVAGVVLTFVVLTIIKFIRENEEKTYIRNAFGHYLSTDVIEQVVNDPAKLSLGGEKVNMTAMFTDVKGFSTISEALKDDPQKLVQLLNRYLTDMSNIILEERGTIDKYEGDAIISFFGAPIRYEDAAIRACRSAVAMKKVEEILNRELVPSGLAPAELKTRIGINTGEMVVGNMGTEKRMDYTMMGHNVNLAARLEGVNKLYGTWIMISEATYEETGRHEHFTVRKLDRVRVVGVTEPIRLYELVDLRAPVDSDPQTIQKLKTFNAGLTAFEQKAWGEAQTLFKQLLEQFPEDGPSRLYERRCTDFMKKAPRRDWDGVYDMQSK